MFMLGRPTQRLQSPCFCLSCLGFAVSPLTQFWLSSCGMISPDCPPVDSVDSWVCLSACLSVHSFFHDSARLSFCVSLHLHACISHGMHQTVLDSSSDTTDRTTQCFCIPVCLSICMSILWSQQVSGVCTRTCVRPCRHRGELTGAAQACLSVCPSVCSSYGIRRCLCLTTCVCVCSPAGTGSADGGCAGEVAPHHGPSRYQGLCLPAGEAAAPQPAHAMHRPLTIITTCSCNAVPSRHHHHLLMQCSAQSSSSPPAHAMHCPPIICTIFYCVDAMRLSCPGILYWFLSETCLEAVSGLMSFAFQPCVLKLSRSKFVFGPSPSKSKLDKQQGFLPSPAMFSTCLPSNDCLSCHRMWRQH